MKPRDTAYLLALRPHHYKIAHRFAAKEGAAMRERFQYPTILAMRDGQPVGLLSTAIQRGRIVASGLVLAKALRRPLITAIRLIECYERVLSAAGVQVYVFGLSGQHTPLQRYLARLGIHPYHADETASWYQRRFT